MARKRKRINDPKFDLNTWARPGFNPQEYAWFIRRDAEVKTALSRLQPTQPTLWAPNPDPRQGIN